MEAASHEDENDKSEDLEAETAENDVDTQLSACRITAGLHSRSCHLTDKAGYIYHNVDLREPSDTYHGVTLAFETANDSTQ